MAPAHTRSSSRMFARHTKRDWCATRVHHTPSQRERANQSEARPVRTRLKRAKQLEPPFRRARPVRHSSQSDSTNRPCSSPFITRVCEYPDPEARWAEPRSPIGREKRRRVFLWIRTFAHAVRPFFLSPKARRAIPPLLSAWCCSRRKKKKKPRRWSAGVGRWRRYDVGEGVMWRLMRCRQGSNVSVDAMWLAWWSGGGVVVEWWLSGDCPK